MFFELLEFTGEVEQAWRAGSKSRSLFNGYLQEAINGDHNPDDFVSASKPMRTFMELI